VHLSVDGHPPLVVGKLHEPASPDVRVRLRHAVRDDRGANDAGRETVLAREEAAAARPRSDLPARPVGMGHHHELLRDSLRSRLGQVAAGQQDPPDDAGNDDDLSRCGPAPLPGLDDRRLPRFLRGEERPRRHPERILRQLQLSSRLVHRGQQRPGSRARHDPAGAVVHGEAATRRWARYALRVAFGLTVLGILTTYSRGGFIGLCVVLIFMFTKSRTKALSFALLLLAGVLAAFVVPDTFVSRIETIASYDQDQSAQARLKAWSLATQVALDSPIFGGGFRTFEQDVWEQYYPDTERAIVAHSIYFQTLAEHGFVGVGIFAALLIATYLGLRRVRKRATESDQTMLANLAGALQASLVGYMVAGAFLSRADFGLFYSVVAMSAAMQ